MTVCVVPIATLPVDIATVGPSAPTAGKYRRGKYRPANRRAANIYVASSTTAVRFPFASTVAVTRVFTPSALFVVSVVVAAPAKIPNRVDDMRRQISRGV